MQASAGSMPAALHCDGVAGACLRCDIVRNGAVVPARICKCHVLAACQCTQAADACVPTRDVQELPRLRSLGLAGINGLAMRGARALADLICRKEGSDSRCDGDDAGKDRGSRGTLSSRAAALPTPISRVSSWKSLSNFGDDDGEGEAERQQHTQGPPGLRSVDLAFSTVRPWLTSWHDVVGW